MVMCLAIWLWQRHSFANQSSKAQPQQIFIVIWNDNDNLDVDLFRLTTKKQNTNEAK